MSASIAMLFIIPIFMVSMNTVDVAMVRASAYVSNYKTGYLLGAYYRSTIINLPNVPTWGFSFHKAAPKYQYCLTAIPH